MSALGLPRSLHSGNAGFIFFGLSNQFVDQAVNAVRQKLDRLGLPPCAISPDFPPVSQMRKRYEE